MLWCQTLALILLLLTILALVIIQSIFHKMTLDDLKDMSALDLIAANLHDLHIGSEGDFDDAFPFSTEQESCTKLSTAQIVALRMKPT